MMRNEKKQGFALLEVVAALGILVMLFGFFYTALNGMYQIQDVYQAESRAVILLNNTVERCNAEKKLSHDIVSSIFLDEFQKSDLFYQEGFSPVCKEEKNFSILSVMKENGKPLAELKFKR